MTKNIQEMCSVARGDYTNSQDQSTKKLVHGNVLVIDDQLSIEGNKKVFGKTEFLKVVDGLPFNFHFATGGDENGNYSIERARDAVQQTINTHGLHGILLDVQFGGDGFLGLSILKELTECFPKIPVIMMTSTNKEALVELDGEERKVWDHCVIRGAVDYLPKKILLDSQNKDLVWRMLDRYVGKNLEIADWLIGQSNMFEVAVRKVGTTSLAGISKILVLGEVGTGKGGLAKYVPRHGGWPADKFFRIDIKPQQGVHLSLTLYGSGKGSFTDQYKEGHTGIFETFKEGGVIFFDEVGNMSTDAQETLQTVIEDKYFIKPGEKPQTIQTKNIQFVFATNKNITDLIKEGKLTEAFLTRIDGLIVELPALRHRPEDIPILFRHLLRVGMMEIRENKQIKTTAFNKLKIPNIPSTLEDQLRNYSWPGNVRDLRKYAEQVVILASASNGTSFEIQKKHFENAWTEFLSSRRYVTVTPTTRSDQAMASGILLPTTQSNQPASTLDGLRESLSVLTESDSLEPDEILQELYLAEFGLFQKALKKTDIEKTGSYTPTKANRLIKDAKYYTDNVTSFRRRARNIWVKLFPSQQQLAKERFKLLFEEITDLLFEEVTMDSQLQKKGKHNRGKKPRINLTKGID